MIAVSFGVVSPPIDLLSWSLVTDVSGDVHAQLQVRMRHDVALGTPVWVVTPQGYSLWHGYVTTIEASSGDTTITATGLVASLANVRYTAFWSDTRFSQWEIPPPTASTDWLPAAWQYDTNNRLYASTRPGETYGGPVGARRAMAWAYRVPDGSLTGISWGQVTVDLVGNMWGWALQAIMSIPEAGVWPFGAGISLTSSGTYTLTTAERPAYALRGTLPTSPIVETNPTDTRTFRVTAVRVARYAPPITASAIASHALTHAQSVLGSSVLRGWSVMSSTTDEEIAVFEDATVREVLEWCTRELNAEWWVDRTSQAVMLRTDRPRRQWTPAPHAVALTAGNDRVITRCYARYKNPSGRRTMRTSTAVNTAAESHYRISRTAVIDVDTTSETTANAVRDAYLAQMSQQPPTAVVTARQRGDIMGVGGPAWPWDAEPGDQMLVVGAPPLTIARRTITPEQTTYELTAPAGTLISALAR